MKTEILSTWMSVASALGRFVERSLEPFAPLGWRAMSVKPLDAGVASLSYSVFGCFFVCFFWTIVYGGLSAAHSLMSSYMIYLFLSISTGILCGDDLDSAYSKSILGSSFLGCIYFMTCIFRPVS